MRDIQAFELDLVCGGEVGATRDPGTGYTGIYDRPVDPAACRSDVLGGGGIGAVAGAALCAAGGAASALCAGVGAVVAGGIALRDSPACQPNGSSKGSTSPASVVGTDHILKVVREL